MAEEESEVVYLCDPCLRSRFALGEMPLERSSQHFPTLHHPTVSERARTAFAEEQLLGVSGRTEFQEEAGRAVDGMSAVPGAGPRALILPQRSRPGAAPWQRG